MARRRSGDLRRELAAQLRAKDRARLRELREAIAAAKSGRRERLRAARALAKAERSRASSRLADLRRALRDATSAARDVGRYVKPGARALGAAAVATAAAEGAADIERAELAKAEAQRERDIERIWSRTGGKASRRRVTLEARAESDGRVEGDIAPELVPVWRRVKRAIAPTARMSRLEAFLHWAHENTATVERIQNEALYADVARMEREARELERDVRAGRRYRGDVATLAARASGEVPF